jgi:hypothetical protein
MSLSKINGQTILAAGVTITDNQLTNATFYIPFVSVTSGTDNLEVDSSGLTYNALTNTLTLGAAGVGILNGGATQVLTTAFSGASATYYPTFVLDNNGTAAAETVLTDAGLTYNPSTNILTAVVTNGGGYAARGTLATAALNPVAGTNYYGGGAASAALSTTVQSRRVYMPKAGTIRACYGYFFQTASASGNLGTLAINVNNGGYTSVGTAAHNVASTIYSNTGLSISVAQGDYIEFRWTAPATTVPTAVTSEFIVYVE